MFRLIKTNNKGLIIAMILSFLFVSLVLFVGCNSEYEKTDGYVVFEDGLGNRYKVEGKKRLKYDVDTRVFSRTIYYDYDPDAVYTFTATAYLKDGDKKLEDNDYDVEDAPRTKSLGITDEESYTRIKDGGSGFNVAHAFTTIPLRGSEPGTYYLYKTISYQLDMDKDSAATILDCYFLIVHINGDRKNTNLTAVFEDGVGNSYTVEGCERPADDETRMRVFEQKIYYDVADDATYTFTGGLYYADGGEQVKAGGGLYWNGDGFYQEVNKPALTLGGEYAYAKKGDYREVTRLDISPINIDGSKSGTYHLLIDAKYYFGNKWESGDGVRLFYDYYYLIVVIRQPKTN